jgi:hypothetical protein
MNVGFSELQVNVVQDYPNPCQWPNLYVLYTRNLLKEIKEVQEKHSSFNKGDGLL